jgi:Astacin (Peptidase family M12A)
MKTILRPFAILTLILWFSVNHAATFGHFTLINDTQTAQTIRYEKIDGDAVIEGDIVIGRIEELEANGAVVIPKVGGTRWPFGIVPFEIDERLPLITKLAIYQAIMHWQQHTNIEFIELTTKNRYDYKDYISFIPGEGTTCSSYVGKKGGKQNLKLAPRCNTGNTIHEIGHAMGFWHEQSRADRASYLKIEWDNIDAKHAHNFDIHITDGKDIGEYDYDSIMHYGSYAFSKNGKKTLIPLDLTATIGQRNGLSKKDIMAAHAMYPEA